MARFQILGPLSVQSDDGLIELTGFRRRALLIRLLIAPGQAISAERLADDVWDGNPPQGAASTLRSHVAHLRRTLGSGQIVTDDGGYHVRAEPGEIDASSFERAA